MAKRIKNKVEPLDFITCMYDNEETYMDRYNTYIEKTSPLIDYYEKQGVVYHVNSNNGKDETHRQVVEILGE